MTTIIELVISQRMGEASVEICPTLLLSGDSVILFDAGMPNQIDLLEAELNKHGYGIMDLTHVILSHQDHDHVGSLAAIKKRNGKLKTVSSAIEEPFISGKSESLRIMQAREYNKTLSGGQLEWGKSFLRYLGTIEPCKIDATCSQDAEKFNDDITIIKTPGHTPGHVSLFVDSSRSFIAGDALALENGAPAMANPQFTLDMSECILSIRKIVALSPQNLYCCHGGKMLNVPAGLLEDFLLKCEEGK